MSKMEGAVVMVMVPVLGGRCREAGGSGGRGPSRVKGQVAS